MELTKVNIVARVNRLLVSYKSNWDDIVDALDMAIDEINTYMSTKYPPVSQVLNEYAHEDATYSYRAGGVDVPFFPQKYFMSIVIPFVATEILTIDEEFSDIYNRYRNQYQENLFVMARDEMSSIPAHLFSAPKGVYFPNPNPVFKSDPEAYFNRQIIMDVPKLKVFYSWGEILLGTEGVTSFVSKPLPVDNNSYEIGTLIRPVVMQDTNFNTFVIDDKGNVLATFLGWSLIESGDNRPIVDTTIELTEDVRFYAVFDYDIVRFKYEGNGGAIQNWKPMYVNGEDTNNDVIPFGGTAVRIGHKFIGFDPTIIEASEINDKTELERINDYSEENEFTFVAQWNLLKYSLTFIGALGDVNLGRDGYVFGDEFELVDPEVVPSSPDEFIGWWDNPLFQGDPITKVYESDYGDKTFYAKYNKETLMIIWLNEDGTEISKEALAKNTLLTPPTVDEEQEFRADNTMTNLKEGHLYIKEFLGFINEDGESPTKVIKNDTFTANYRTVAVMSTLKINFKRNNSGTIVDESSEYSFQVGETLDKGELILLLEENINYIGNEATPITHYVNDFSLLDFEEEAISGDSFDMEKLTEIYCLYSSTVVNVTIERKIWDETTSALILDESYSPLVLQVPTGSSYSYVKGLITIDEDNIKSVINAGGTSLYLNSFKKWSDPDEIEAPATFNESTTLRPAYSETVNEDYTRTLTIIGFPSAKNSALTTTKGFQVPMNISINLNGSDYEFCKDSINNDDDYLFLLASGFYSVKVGEEYANLINSVVMRSDLNIYLKTESKEQFHVLFGDIDIKTFYPYELEAAEVGGVVTINALDLSSIETIPPTGYEFAGWNPVEYQADQGIVNNSAQVNVDRDTDLIFYPVYKLLAGFKINISITDISSNALITDFTGGQTLEITVGSTFENTTTELFASYNDLINLINGEVNQNKQQRGYDFYRWKQDGLSSHDSFGVYISYPKATSELQEINLNIQLVRDTNYSLITISPTMLNLSTNAYQSAYNEYKIGSSNTGLFKVFVYKSSLFYQLYFGSDTGWSTDLPQLTHSNDILQGLHDDDDPETNYNYYYTYNSNTISNDDNPTNDMTIQLVRSGVL